MTDALFASLNGERIIAAAVTVPFTGTWVADVVLALSDAVSKDPGGCTLKLADLTLKGTVYRTASFSGARSVLLVGGYGGWLKNLASRQYFLPGGVPLSMVLTDAAKEVGETVSLASNPTLAAHWTREAQPASRLLRNISPGGVWYVDTGGVTQVGRARSSTPIASSFDVVARSGAKGKFTVATETLSDWMPGRSFTAPTVTTAQTLSLVRFVAANDGQLRVEALTA